MIEFSEYAVPVFHIIMNAFNQISSPARERKFFFPRHQFIERKETAIA
jgi:hypothetical protein